LTRVEREHLVVDVDAVVVVGCDERDDFGDVGGTQFVGEVAGVATEDAGQDQGARGAPGRYLFGSGGAAVVEEGPAGVWRVPEWMDDVDDVEVRCDGGGPTGVLGRRVPH